MYKRNSHCSFCGSAFNPNDAWPRKCSNCQNTTFLNPTPVAVILLPVDDGLYTIRRNIEPKKGQLALPGGYINLGESWQTAAARELYEESGVKIEASEVTLFNVLSAPDGTVLIFGLAKARSSKEISEFIESEESTEALIIKEFQDLAFPLHTQVVKDFFSKEK
ncbi:MAG: NUDIX domain-containing protein [Acidobacteria bacterium]|nr:NUDIX domain-containing protein [Acidobacteriota bacterium]